MGLFLLYSISFYFFCFINKIKQVKTWKTKKKILVVPSDRTGVSYFRSTKPHTLENNYPDEFHVDVDYEPQIDNDEWLKQYDIIHYHRTLGDYDNMEKLTERLKNLGLYL
jgi:hypothetical protein